MSMRIQAYNQVGQVYGSKKTVKTAAAAPAAKRDAVEFSSIGKDFQLAKKAVSQAPDVRKDIVEPIKAKVQNGTYEVSNESFADKLIEKYYA